MKDAQSQAAPGLDASSPHRSARRTVPIWVLRPLVVTLLIVLLLAATWIYLRLESTTPAFDPATAAVGSGIGMQVAFDLVDHTGQAVTLQDFRGAPLLVFFGYTNCPDVCPTTLSRVATLLDVLASDGTEAQAVFISVDPERDTPASLASYVEAFHPRLTGLTGGESSLNEATESFRVYFQKVDDGTDDYLLDHSAYIYLVGSEGELLSYYHPDLASEVLSEDIRSRLQDSM